MQAPANRDRRSCHSRNPARAGGAHPDTAGRAVRRGGGEGPCAVPRALSGRGARPRAGRDQHAQARVRRSAPRRSSPFCRGSRSFPPPRPGCGALARLLGPWRSPRRGRASPIARGSRPARPSRSMTRRPEAYLALGEYQFQDNDLTGALDTWERGLRLNPGDAALARRLERGRAEARRLGGLERLASEHFVVAFDGRADVPGARASLEIMEAAYRSVGALFKLYPDGPIPVVLYPDRSYDKEGHISWSASSSTGRSGFPRPVPASSRSLSRDSAPRVRPSRSSIGPPGGGADRRGSTRASPSVAATRADPGPAVRCTPGRAFSSAPRSLEATFGSRHTSTAPPRLSGGPPRRGAHPRAARAEPASGPFCPRCPAGAPFATAFERALGEDYSHLHRRVRRRGTPLIRQRP